jgi:ABC-type sulfate transport system permease subunit
MRMHTQVFLLSLLDLPFSISPVVTGLMLTLLYGRNGWFGPLLQQLGVNVVFAFTGQLATGLPVDAQNCSCPEYVLPTTLSVPLLVP